jgi:predicted MFS family arabinose efflux permease
MAMKMAVVILGGVLGGQKLDEVSQNSSPWYTITLSLFSVAVAIYIVIAETKR